MLKKITKSIIGRSYSKFDYPLIINSYGRSGSTVLTNSIINCVTDNKYLNTEVIRRGISDVAWDLEKTKLKKGIIYKTHDYPPKIINNKDIKMIYTYADPVDVVLSLLNRFEERGEAWMKEHFNHLKVDYTNFNIVNEDQLKLENHLDSWINETRIPIAFIRYEEMWNYQDEISNFLDLKIKLPSFKKRKAKEIDDKKLISKISDTYSSLIYKVEKFDNFKIINNH